MISRAGKSNFLKDHYEWLALGVGILALLGAVWFCLFGGDIEMRIDETVGSVSNRGASAATVAALDLAPYDGATNTANINFSISARKPRAPVSRLRVVSATARRASYRR